MIEFNVPDISCGHCAGVVQKTVKALDHTATVEVDIPTKHVKITSEVDRAAFADALAAAGYPPSGPW
ncbi:MAG: heavy-metal-associated domain-containing protein [Burkholderiales bacterium]